jgi:protein-disulfide isomerase
MWLGLAVSLSIAALTVSLVNYKRTSNALSEAQTLAQRVQAIKPWAYSSGELTTALATYSVNRPEARAVVPGLEVVNAERSYGSATSKFTIIEYSDFECPACRAHFPELINLVESSGGNISLVFKHVPAHGKTSMNQAIAAECAALQDGNNGFFKMAGLIFETTEGSGAGVVRPVGQLAKEMNLDHREFMRCMDQQTPIGKVRADLDEAIGLGIQQTPSSLLVYKDRHALLQGMYTGEQLMAVFAELANGEGDQSGKAKPGAPL